MSPPPPWDPVLTYPAQHCPMVARNAETKAGYQRIHSHNDWVMILGKLEDLLDSVLQCIPILR
jgi:hypothetical protein